MTLSQLSPLGLLLIILGDFLAICYLMVIVRKLCPDPDGICQFGEPRRLEDYMDFEELLRREFPDH